MGPERGLRPTGAGANGAAAEDDGHRSRLWLRTNASRHERFLLFIDEFDPHEPFDTPEPYASQYDPSWEGPKLIWPPYAVGPIAKGHMPARDGHQVRANYGSSLTMIDRWFGKLLDAIDELGLIDDTMIVLCSDHGHYLGEKTVDDLDIWGKPAVPFYETAARPEPAGPHGHTGRTGHSSRLRARPRRAAKSGQRRSSETRRLGDQRMDGHAWPWWRLPFGWHYLRNTRGGRSRRSQSFTSSSPTASGTSPPRRDRTVTVRLVCSLPSPYPLREMPMNPPIETSTSRKS